MLEALLVSLAFILGTTALSLLVYLAMRRAMRASIDQAATDLAGSVLTRIAGLHALILALVFAQEMLSYAQLQTENATEANAVADVYFDAARYGDGAAEHKIQDALFSYVRIVIDQEWGQLDDSGHLLQPAWDAWDAAYQGVLDLEPATGRQKSLREHMLDQSHVIATTRVKRESHESSISGMFWFAALAGVVCIALAYYPYRPERHTLDLIGLLGAFTGVILLFIFAFANPFGEPGALEPRELERVLAQIEQSR